jgi:predicted Holliday junction resolvase-like endonuclease
MVVELIVVTIIFVILIVVLWKYLLLKEDFNSLRCMKQSQSVKYGQLTEQWIPFAKQFPFESQNFRFIGKPIDGISFEDDKIVFVEFKTNTSQLSDIQKKVKALVEEKKVEWFELRVE